MKLTWIDWAVIAGYLVINFGIGLYYKRRAGKNTSEFFLSGRNIPWWLAGTSMVATTFAADTPLVVTGMTARNGIAGNWLWWNFLMSGMMTVFFFARLWRRAEVLTDNELTEIRYSGRPAAVLRGFRSIYLGVFMNCIILGWVNLAMVKILMLTMGLTKIQSMVICLIFIGGYTAYYTTISGLWGVLVTDLFQFFLKWGMTIVLAVFAVKAVGGIASMKTKLLAIDAQRAAAAGAGGSGHIMSFIPDVGSLWMPLMAFFVYIGVQWWACWYPGAEPGGGGYIAQRIFCAKDEKNSLLATLWFNIAHYALRPWPWIIVALCAVILYPPLMAKDPEMGYIQVLMDYLPISLRGVMLAAFGAAYMSTVGTQLNWGSSYIVNDFYKRFLKRDGNEKHYVTASKMATMLLMVISAAVTSQLTSIQGAWELLLSAGAGTGTVYILRWYWWRINAWSEISAMVSALVTALVVNLWVPMQGSEALLFGKRTLITVSVTTFVWLVTTFITSPEPTALLLQFYRRVTPTATGWAPIARLAPEITPNHDGMYNFLDFVFGCALVYCSLFGIGRIVLGEPRPGLLFLVGAFISGAYIYWDFSRRGWEALAGKQTQTTATQPGD